MSLWHQFKRFLCSTPLPNSPAKLFLIEVEDRSKQKLSIDLRHARMVHKMPDKVSLAWHVSVISTNKLLLFNVSFNILDQLPIRWKRPFTDDIGTNYTQADRLSRETLNGGGEVIIETYKTPVIGKSSTRWMAQVMRCLYKPSSGCGYR